MARIRDSVLLAGLMAGALTAPAMAALMSPTAVAAAPLVLAQYYQQERPYYGRPPPRRQICRTEYRRVFVGRDQWGRPLYRNMPRRVCFWR